MNKDFKHHLNLYLSYILGLREALKYVNQTITLEKKGFEIIYAIDCSEVFKFCFPFQKEIIKIEYLPDETQKEISERESTILWNIFSCTKRLVLLPPHKAELIRKIQTTINKKAHNENGLKNFKEIKAKLITQDSFNRVAGIIEGYKKTGSALNITKEQRDTLLHFMENNYSEVKSVETLAGLTGLERIKNMFEKGIIQYFDDAFKKFQISEEDLSLKTIPFYEQFLREFEKDKELNEYAKFIDAVSCVYLEFVNRQLIPEKKIVIFVSRSRRMLKIIDEFVSKTLTSELSKYDFEFFTSYSPENYQRSNFSSRNISLSRNLQYFVLYKLYHHLETNNELNKWNNLVTELSSIEELYYSVKELLINESFQENDKYNRVVIAVNKLHKLIHNDENVKLFLIDESTRKSSLDEYKDAELKDFLDTLHEIIDSDKFSDECLVERYLRVNQDLKNGLKILLNELYAYKWTTKLDYEKVWIEVNDKTNLITLDWIHGEPPIQIQIQNRIVRNKAKELFSHLPENTDFKYLKNKLNNYKDIDNIPEYKILPAHLEVLTGNYEKAFEILSNVSGNDGKAVDNKCVEMIYYKCVLFRKLEKPLCGIESIEKIINIKRDPRYLREKGVLIWQSLQLEKNTPEYLSIVDILGCDLTIECAYECLLEAFQLNGDKNMLLKVLLLNSLAYILAEYDNLKAIKYSIDYADSLVKTFNENFSKELWLPRFEDTLGFVNYRFCLLNNDLPLEKKKYHLNEAIIHFNQALDSNLLIGNEYKTVCHHLFAANKYLEGIL